MSTNDSSLLGRRHECDTLSDLVAAAEGGRSRVVVLRGEAGIGRTALLDFVADRAAGCRVARAAGVASETELAYAGLHQLCSPYLDRLAKLPDPQGEALGTAFRLVSGAVPDRFVVGLAVLTLLSQVAGEQPLICVVDDAQWLDGESARTLEFVARRLTTERIGIVFAVRGSDDEPTLAGLPELVLGGLDSGDAAALLDSAVTGTLDRRVRDRLLAECRGNPFALLELPRALAAAELAYGCATDAGAGPRIHQLERAFQRRVRILPPESRRLLLVAALEPLGDVALLWRAAELLGVGSDAATAAEAAGLIELHDGVRFRHPLVRSAVHRSAAPAERRAAHRALAEVTDPDADKDRRAWHRARAAVSQDETVAVDLERSADRAFAHGGLPAAAAFLAHAAALTPDPASRARRSLDAARAKAHAGAFHDALTLLAIADAAPLDDAGRAGIDLLRAEITFAADPGDEAVPSLLAAARRIRTLHPGLTRTGYLGAFSAALFAGRPIAGAGEVAHAVRAAPPSRTPGRGDNLLEAFAALIIDGHAAAAPLASRAVRAFATEEPTLDSELRFGRLAAAMAASVWDDASWDVLTRRHLDVVRRAGALSILPPALDTRTVVHVRTGNLAAAASLVRESRSVTDVTRSGVAADGEVALLAVRGHAGTGPGDVTAGGEGAGVNLARAVACNGLGRYHDALAAAVAASAGPLRPGAPTWALGELVEAGVYSGRTDAAAAALEQLCTLTRVSGTDWALGAEAGARALLREGDAAEALHREAIDRLGRTRICVDLARARLRYGEWLRREGRRVDARAQLRTAYDTLTAMGADAFAARARRELLATGETVRKRTVETFGELTAQEAHIARLAADGLTNPQISTVLYISPRTVEWHLRKVFTKLGVNTRRQLPPSLPGPDRTVLSRR